MKIALEVKINTLSFPEEKEASLKNIFFSAAEGEFLAISGRAAAGKSLLLSAITGAAAKLDNAILDGTIKIFEEDRCALPLNRSCEVLGYMSQEPLNQIVSTTVAEEIAFGLANMNCSPEEIRERTTRALGYVGLRGAEQKKTASLSGGQAQRLVLGSILALETPLLLLDQPGAELDLRGKAEFYSYLRRLNREKGVTVVMVMDNGIEIKNFAHRVLTLEHGTLISDIPSAEYCRQSFHRWILPEFPEGEETLIKVNNIAFTYRCGNIGLEQVNFEVKEGEFVAVMGENGSGKTTLLKLIEGLLTPTKGAITIFGEKYTKKNAVALRCRIGFLFQNPDFQIFSSSLREEVAFALKQQKLSRQECAQRVDKALEAVGLGHLADVHPQRLSRSQRQKLAFASAIIHKPKLLIADEPTAGLSEEDGQMIMELLSDFRRQGGTVVLVSHDLALTKAFAGRILILDKHQLVGDFHRSEFDAINEEMFYSSGDLQ